MYLQVRPRQLISRRLQFITLPGVAYCNELKSYVSVHGLLENVHPNVARYLSHPSE